MLRPISLLLLALAACDGGDGSSTDGAGEGEGEGEGLPQDSDGDGLSDEEEAGIGSDPELEDSDEDGLTDAEEVEAGTDPVSEDSDGDGYMDAHEINEGSDPTDAESKIYTGGWPYNPDKDQMEDPGWESNPDEGERLVHFEMIDQFGETVDIYDFAMQGRPVVLDVSAMWCTYCQEMAKWLEGDASYYDNFDRYDWYEEVPALVNSGQVYWITVLTENRSGGPPDQETVERWADAWPNPHVPVLADVDQALIDWFGRDLYGYPTVLLLDETLTFTVYDPYDYTAVFSELADTY